MTRTSDWVSSTKRRSPSRRPRVEPDGKPVTNIPADESTPTPPSSLKRALARLTTLPLFSPRLDVVHLEVAVPNLPEALIGFRIAQLSDLHVGVGSWGPMRLSEAATVLRTEGCDLQVNTGDFVQGQPSLEAVLAAVRVTLAPIGAGEKSWPTVAIPGNHDFYAGEAWVHELGQALARLGVCFLTNRVIQHEHRGECITIAGLAEGEPGFQAAVESLMKSPRPRILAVHAPDVVEHLPGHCADIILAGHTHGGQIALPLMTRWIVRHGCGSRYVGGRYLINGNRLYINRGLGCTGYPIRFRAAPELTFLHLVR